MNFENDLKSLVGTPLSQAKHIFGSIFHLYFTMAEGEAEFVCNGTQWALLNADGAIVLHDEAALSSEILSGAFTGKRLRAAEASAAMLTLRFDDVVLHAFQTEDYHLFLHDGVALGSAEWRSMNSSARESFMLFAPDREATGYEFSQYLDLTTVPWGPAYLAKQEGADG